MSFSYSKTGVADEIRADIKAQQEYQVPSCLKDFLLMAIHGLKERHGAGVEVDVWCAGHLCTDGQTYEVSEARIQVKRKEPVVLPLPSPEPQQVVDGRIGSGGLAGSVATDENGSPLQVNNGLVIGDDPNEQTDGEAPQTEPTDPLDNHPPSAKMP